MAPRLKISSGSAGAIFISFRGWLQQLALGWGKKEEERKKSGLCVGPAGFGRATGAPGAKCKGRVCRGAPPGQRGPRARRRANETQIKSTGFAEAVVRAC